MSRSWWLTVSLILSAVAVDVVAFVWPLPWWKATALTVTGVAIVMAMLLAIYREGGRGVFWSGFALSAGVYAVLTLYFGLGGYLPSGKVQAVANALLESKQQGYVVERNYSIQRPVQEYSGGIVRMRFVTEYVQEQRYRQYDIAERLTIGHGLFSLLIGLTVGGTAAGMYARHNRMQGGFDGHEEPIPV